MQAAEQQISQLFEIIDELEARYGAELYTGAQWQTIKSEWEGLRDQALKTE